MFQTKNPERFKEHLHDFPENFMLGITLETNREELIAEYSEAPTIENRVNAMLSLSHFPLYVTIEPILNFDVEEFVQLIRWIKPDKVFIGADSKVHKYPKVYNNLVLDEPDAEKILKLIEELEKFTVVEQKSNLSRLLGRSEANEV